MQFRILPLYHGIDHHDLVRRYPLLSNIRGEKADLDCDILVSKLNSVLKKVKEIENIPIIKPETVSTPVILDGTTSSAKEVSKNEMEEIYTELRRDTTKNRKQATITKLRSYSDRKRIWKHSVTWDIISYLLNSDTTAMDGLYVIEYMIKLSQKEYPDDLNPVIYNVRERFLPRLLNLSQPGVEKRLSGDSFGILRIIIEENLLSRYALEALNLAMNELNDREYSDYIEKYVLHFDQASKKNQEDLCNFMYDLTLRDDKVGTRDKILYDYFIKNFELWDERGATEVLLRVIADCFGTIPFISVRFTGSAAVN